MLYLLRPLTLERGCHRTGQTVSSGSRTGGFCGLKATKDKEFAMSKIRLFGCSWHWKSCSHAERFSMSTGAQEVYKNPPQRLTLASYFLHFQLKGNRQFLRQLVYGKLQNFADCDFGKDIRSAHIPVCRFYDLGSSGRKVKTDFSPFIVVVGIPMYCFVLVCSGGDFLFLLVLL